MKSPLELSEEELKQLRSYFEPAISEFPLNHQSNFERLCGAILKTGQLLIDKMIVEKISLRGR